MWHLSFSWSKTTNYVSTFHEPPSFRPRCSWLSAIGHPRVGTKLHWARNPRLGKVNGKTHSHQGRILSQESLTPTAHRISFPTCLSHPRSIHLHCHTIHRLFHLPYLGFQQQVRPKFSDICSSYWTPSRRTHFLNTLSHLERVAHRLETYFFKQLQLNSIAVRTTTTTTTFPKTRVTTTTKNGYGHRKRK
jgi:hypothetical protein